MADPEINPTEQNEPYSPPHTIRTISQKLGIEPSAPFSPLETQGPEAAFLQRIYKIGANSLAALAVVTPLAEAATALANQPARSEGALLRAAKDGSIPSPIWNGAVLLGPGISIHSSGAEGQKTIIGTVEPGHQVLLEHPRLFRDKNGVLWAAVSQATRSNRSNQATDPKQVSWINLTKAQQRHRLKSLAYSNYNPASSSTIPRTITASVNSHNNLQAKAKSDILPKHLSTMAMLPTSRVPNILRAQKLVGTKINPRFIVPSRPAQPAPSPEGNSPSLTPLPPNNEIVPKPDQPIPPVQPPETIPGDPNTGPLEKLPGSKDVLTSQEKAIYRDSQVQFLRNGQNWIDGTLVSYQGKIYVVTCAHGIAGDLNAQHPEKSYNPDGYFTEITGPTDLISQIGSVAYTVGTFGGQQVSVVSMVAMPGKDLLLLGLEDQSAAAQLGKALPIETTNFGGERARPAANVDAVGHSQISGYKEIEGSEIYAGKINLKSYNGENRDVYAVADNVEDYRTAPNGFGTSGRSVIVKNSDGTYSFLVGNSVRFFRNDRRGQLLPGDYPPGADWVDSQLRQKMPSATFNGVTGYELYTSVTKSELVALANLANR